MIKPARIVIPALLLILTAGCTTLQSKQAPADSAEQLYQEGRQAQSSGDYQQAIDRFTQLSTNYPTSPYTQQVSIETAYAHYQLKQYDQAVAEAQRFLQLNPKHQSADYAHYLIGLSHSGQASNDNDPQQIRQAYNAFAQLVQKFPDSHYRDDATQRMVALRNQLARGELEAVKGYLAQNNQAEAIRRAKYINQYYGDTPAAAEALDLVTRAATIEIGPKKGNQFLKITAPNDTQSAARESWFLQQNPNFYTLQIDANEARQPLVQLAQQHGLDNQTLILHRQHEQRNWYSLFYGTFITWGEAIDAAAQLRKQTGLINVEIRQYQELQRIVH